jgi:hypothetical protein
MSVNAGKSPIISLLYLIEIDPSKEMSIIQYYPLWIEKGIQGDVGYQEMIKLISHF